MATYVNTTKNTVSVSNVTKTLTGNILATAGLYMGFGCFNYSGGEVLVSGSLPIYTNVTKNVSTFTNQTKN